MWLPPNAAQINGKDSMRAWVLTFTTAWNFSIAWEVPRVEVSSSGDLAYSMGSFEFSLKDPEGNAVYEKGKFMNV